MLSPVKAQIIHHYDQEFDNVEISAWLLVVARNMIADRFKSKPYQKEVLAGTTTDYAAESFFLFGSRSRT